MTTIACDGMSMAADSLVTGGGERVGWFTKAARAKDGRIFACAGSAVDSIKFERWMGGAEAESVKLKDEFEALVLNIDGTIDWVGSDLEPLRYFAPMTIGSGAGIALGAMLAGKTPEEAVMIACQRDIKSGGTVTVVHLDQHIMKEVA